MKARLITPILMLIGAFLSLSAMTAQAAFQQVIPTGSPLMFGSVEIEYNPDAQEVWYTDDANGDVGNQSSSSVGNAVADVFGVSPVYFLEAEDSLGNTEHLTFTPTIPFDVIAIHAGIYEIFFKYSPALASTFNITDVDGNAIGLSNFRTYSFTNPGPGPGPVVPIPAAVWLFGSGLLGLIGLGSRKTSVA